MSKNRFGGIWCFRRIGLEEVVDVESPLFVAREGELQALDVELFNGNKLVFKECGGPVQMQVGALNAEERGGLSGFADLHGGEFEANLRPELEMGFSFECQQSFVLGKKPGGQFLLQQ